MRSALGIFVASFVVAKKCNKRESSSDVCLGVSDAFESPKNCVLLEDSTLKNFNRVTPFINGGLPVALFSHTRAYKFTELTYLTIKSLVLPNLNFLGPIAHGFRKLEKKNRSEDVQLEVYSLLLHVINTINPIAFDAYYAAFHSGRFYECFLILQRLYSSDSEIERLVLSNVLFLNRRIRRDAINSIAFIDVTSKDIFCIDLPTLRCEKRISFHLPKQVLKFEEFVLLSFSLDEAIMCDIEHFCPLGLRPIYLALIKRFNIDFHRLTPEQRILRFLRIKFFVFNSVGLSISFLSSGSCKKAILDLLIRSAKAENDEFFRAYAGALGLLNK